MAARFEHIGIAVRDLEKAKKLWRDAFGLEVGETKPDFKEHVNNAYVDMGDIKIQLMEPMGDEGTLARFIEKKGEGVHHIHLVIDDMEQTFKTLQEQDVPLVDKAPVLEPGNRKHLILHPRGTNNILIQLSDK